MKLTSSITDLNRILILALCVAVSYLWAGSIRSGKRGIMTAVDFGGVYYGARCALDHDDPYNTQTCVRDFEAGGGQVPGKDAADRAKQEFVLMLIYPPTALLMVAPLAMLLWPTAQMVWILTMAGLFLVAAFLAWDLASEAPVLSGCIACFMMLNCFEPLSTGNPVGIVVPLCVVAVWCFTKGRAVLVGVLALSVALVVKPHDAGLVWLYFLLAGGVGRKRALQTLGVAAVFAVAAAVWISPISPNWVHEMSSNLSTIAAHGGASDPGPAGIDERSFSPIISLQNSASVFRDDAHFYNPVSYLIAGGLILVWLIAVLRRRPTREGALLALAAISALTMLPVYHRAEDAKLLLLALPAFAMLWASKERIRWVALALTSLSIFVTSDYPVAFFAAITQNVPAPISTLGGKLTLLALQPAPLVLLVTGCFYLWMFIRYRPTEAVVITDGVASTAIATAV
ncbi:MAG TPA: glycosyltransferase family 87 protein [Terracidiphilus sp.]|nr:glycosyltransferase family 87 protein [Terracidiphilus sp.]